MYRTLEIFKLSKLFAYLSLLVANFNAFLEWRIAVNARDYSMEIGMDHWAYGHNLISKYPGALIPGDHDLLVLLEDMLSLPKFFAVKVMDVMIYIDKPLFEGLRNGLIEAAYHNNEAALDLLILYTIICCKEPEKIFEMPEPFRTRALIKLKEDYGIDMTKGKDMPDFLLSVLVSVNSAIPFLLVVVFFLNINFFSQTHLGNVLFAAMFLFTYWGVKISRLLRRISLMKLHYPSK